MFVCFLMEALFRSILTHFTDDIFKFIFLNVNIWSSINISLKFVRKGQINNNPALVQIVAWRRPGDKPLSASMMLGLNELTTLSKLSDASLALLTHLDLVTHKWVIKLSQHWFRKRKNVDILLIGHLGTIPCKIPIKIQPFEFKKMHLKMSSPIWWPFSLGLIVLQ